MLLFDGAMGTMKQAGLDTRSIHRAYIQAGSQVVTTDTFMANRLSTSDVEGENARALEAARETNVLVAGDLGPTIATSKDYPLSCFHDLYREQAKALKGVDFWCAGEGGAGFRRVPPLGFGIQLRLRSPAERLFSVPACFPEPVSVDLGAERGTAGARPLSF